MSIGPFKLALILRMPTFSGSSRSRAACVQCVKTSSQPVASGASYTQSVKADLPSVASSLPRAQYVKTDSPNLCNQDGETLRAVSANARATIRESDAFIGE